MKNNYNRVHEGQQSGKADASIASMLKIGKENAVSAKELLRLSGCENIRALQKRIAEERNKGAIICSGSGAGYWLPKKPQGNRGLL